MKLIIWDFDGTLADTKPIIEAGMDHALKIMGLDPSIKTNWLQYVGLPAKEGAYHTFNHLGISIDSVINAYRSFNYEKHRHLIKGFAGISELLDELKTLGIAMSIASSKSKTTLMYQLEVLKWPSYFYPIVTPNDVKFGKPHPESIYRCLRMCNVDAKDAIMIGDTQFDLDMAKNANIASIAVSYGFQSHIVPTTTNLIACVANVVDLRREILAWSLT